MGLNWLFAALMVAFAGWVAWRGYEAYTYRRLLLTVQGELDETKVRLLADGIQGRTIPNSPALWAQLREIEARVMCSAIISDGLKQELHVLLESKGLKY